MNPGNLTGTLQPCTDKDCPAGHYLSRRLHVLFFGGGVHSNTIVYCGIFKNKIKKLTVKFFFCRDKFAHQFIPLVWRLKISNKKIKNATDENSYKTVLKKTFLQGKVERSVRGRLSKHLIATNKSSELPLLRPLTYKNTHTHARKTSNVISHNTAFFQAAV